MSESVTRKFDIPHILLFSLVYGVAIVLTDLLPATANLVFAIWPVGGIGLASLVLLPRRQWPAMIAALSTAAVVAAILIGRSTLASFGFMTSNMFESTLSALVLTSYGGGFGLNKVSGIASLVFSAIIVNACTATIGATTAALDSGMPFVSFWFNWWVVDGISILLITPVVLCLVNVNAVAGREPVRSLIEYSAFFAIWIGITWFAFNSKNPLTGMSPHPYLLIVLLAWPAIRFGARPLSLTLLALAVITVSSHAILLGPSPLLGNTMTLRLLFSQSFLAITSITTWLLFASFAERREAEQWLHRLNRELRAISNCNQVLVRTDDEQTLLNEICRIIYDEAGYCMVWIGYVEHDDAKTVRSVAWSGFDNGYIANAKISWADDTERGRGPGGTSIRSGEIVCIQDIATDPQMVPWRESALLRGYHSVIALPLKDENANVFGVLLIYSTEINSFTPEEIRLMEELAGDLAFGIVVLRARIDRKQAEEDLAQMNERFFLATNAARLGVWDWDIQRDELVWDDIMYELYGIKKGDFAGNYEAWAQGVHPDDRALLGEIFKLALRGEQEYDTEYRVVWPDGSIHYLKVYGQILRDVDGRPMRMTGINFDITERVQSEEHKRKFYRSTILAATEGKLLLTEREELERIAGPPTAVFQIASMEDFRDIRQAVVEFARSSGADETRVSDYLVAVGEAVTNAIKHAGGGLASIHILPGAILFMISDKGPGIDTMTIPEVALVKGYTTAGTLGMGYKIIISIADRVYLVTGPEGTIVGIEMVLQQAQTKPDLDAFFRNW